MISPKTLYIRHALHGKGTDLFKLHERENNHNLVHYKYHSQKRLSKKVLGAKILCFAVYLVACYR